MKILIVDDQKTSRMILRAKLESWGYTVEEAVSGLEALDLARATPPDLIISDILMTEIDGFTLRRALKGIGQLCQVPFIFYTATYLDDEDKILGQALGASRYIRKPVDPAELLRVIDEVIAVDRIGKPQTSDLSLDESSQIEVLHHERLAQKLDKKIRDIDVMQQQHAMVIDSTSEGILCLDLKGRHSIVNKAARRLLGYELDELTGVDSHSLWHHTKEDGSAFHEDECPILASMKDGGKLDQVEDLFWRKNGSSFPVEYSCSPLLEQGEIQGVVVIFRDIGERKKMEKAMMFTQFAVDNNSVATYKVEKDGKIAYANYAACQSLGYTREELQSISVSDISPDYSTDTWPKYWQEMKDLKSHTFEATAKKKSGEVFPVDVHISHVEHQNEQFIWANVNDITIRKQAELALRDSELRFRMIYENAPVFILAFDKNGRCLLWNKQCLNTFGWTIDEINEKQDVMSQFIPDPANIDMVLRDIENEPDGVFWEWHQQTKDGRTLTTMWATFRLPDGISFCMGYDITEQRQVEAELHEKEALFRAVTMSALDAIIIVDSDGVIRLWNKSAETMFGYKAGEVEGLQHADLIIPEGLRDDFVKALTSVRNNKKYEIVGSIVESSALRSDGSEFPVDIAVSGIKKDDGFLLIGFVRDVTKRKQRLIKLKTQLEELQRWQDATLGRETRNLELKAEINKLLNEMGQSPRYPSAEGDGEHHD